MATGGPRHGTHDQQLVAAVVLGPLQGGLGIAPRAHIQVVEPHETPRPGTLRVGLQGVFQIDIAGLHDEFVANVALVDIDSDGWLDLVYSTYRNGTYIVYNDEGSFSDANKLRLPNHEGAWVSAAVGFGDLNEDGRLDISNNRMEQSIKPFAVGRKNWLFSNSQRGATASANLYSLIETAKANGKEPYSYLCWLFEKLPEADLQNIETLMPWNMPE